MSSERSSFAIMVEPTVSVLHRWAKPPPELFWGDSETMVGVGRVCEDPIVSFDYDTDGSAWKFLDHHHHHHHQDEEEGRQTGGRGDGTKPTK